jgi:hypothetical protein
MRDRVRRSLTAGAAGVLLAGALTASATAPAQATTDGYETCPYGKVCLYEGLWGTGARWDVPGCGKWTVPSWMIALGVSSVRTYGNAVWLSISGQVQIGSVPQWTSTNLGPNENDRVYSVSVIC